MKKFVLFALCLTFLASASLFMVGCKNNNKHTHSFTVETVTDKYLSSAATCTQKAKYFYSCKCGEKGTETFEYGDALGHKFTNYVSDNNATCTEDGTKTAKCDRCDETDTVTDVGSKLQHTYDKQVATDEYLCSEATCTQKAKYYYSCKCGEKGTETFEYGDTLGHSFTNYVSDNNATCTEDGTKTAKCDHCDETDTITDTGSKLGHSFTNYVSDNNATYEKNGTKTAHCDHKGCTATDTIIDEDSKLESYMAFKTLSVNGDKVYGKVSNDTKTFSFINEIEAVGLIKYVVSLDVYGSQQVATKTIPLNVGDNTVYIIEMLDGEFQTEYEVTIRRRPMYTVSFDTNGGTEIPDRQIEEDFCATMPESAERKGYTFVKWNYDFSTPITKDTTISAEWNIITYNIYYNLNGGTLEGENPTTYTVEDEILLFTPTKRGYNSTWDNNGKIGKGSIGDKTFSASYTPIVYKITYDCGKGTNNSLNPLEYTIESETIVLSDAYYINADFVEWRQNGVKVTEIAKGSIGSMTLTAVWDEYDVKLQVDGDCYTIIGLNCDKTDIVIKSAYKGKKVISISDEAFYNCSQITTITIPDSVTTIGSFAFFGCSGLTSIVIPNGETTIGYAAFGSCNGLTSIVIPNSVKRIGEEAFDGCEVLTNIYINDLTAWFNISGLSNLMGKYTSINKNIYLKGELIKDLILPSSITSIGDSAFYNCSGLTSIVIPNSVTSIGDYAFYNCSGLKSITIPNSVTSIGDCAFSDCSGLTGITIPDSVISIGNWAFSGCDGLMSITIPDGATSIGYYAFAGCSSLTEITLPDSITTISGFAFRWCSSLTSITIPDSVTTIGNSAFEDCIRLADITIGDSVTLIGDSAFYGCRGLISVTIPDSVTRIAFDAFTDCSRLKSIVFGKGIKTIFRGTFEGCNSLTSITIPDNVTSIGLNVFSDTAWYNNQPDGLIYFGKVVCGYKGTMPDNAEIVIKEGTLDIAGNAFSGCRELTSITIPDSVTTIGDYAFWDCSGLTSIVIPNSVTSIGNCAFYNCSGLTSITIPDSVTSIGDSAFSRCRGLTSINVSSGNTKYHSENDCLIETSINTLILGCENSVIPYGVTAIGNYAFSWCSGLTSIVIPDSVTSIGDYAFSWCRGLTGITIPDSVISIGNWAFSECSKLTSITIPDGVTSIGDYAFAACIGLTNIIIPSSVTTIGDSAFNNCYSLTNIIIPDGITSIGENTFYGCSGLTSITIPNSVTSIGRSAFEFCDRLNEITIHDSVAIIGFCAFRNCSELKTIYYKGSAENWNKIYIDGYNTNLTRATRYYYSEIEPTLNADGTGYDGNYWHYDTDGKTLVIWKKEN